MDDENVVAWLPTTISIKSEREIKNKEWLLFFFQDYISTDTHKEREKEDVMTL